MVTANAAPTPGSVDPTFQTGRGPNDLVKVIAVQSDGKILIGGDFVTFDSSRVNHIARLNSDSTLDNTFNSGTGANDKVAAILLQSDGKILIGGNFTSYNGTPRNRLARLNPDGTLDSSFNSGSGANDRVAAIVLQSDGKILIGGNFTSYNGVAHNRVARLNSDGTLDTTFNPGTGTDKEVLTIAVQSNGKILLGGNFTTYNGIGRNFITRVNSDGTLDETFTSGGRDAGIQKILIQNDGKILINGDFTLYTDCNCLNIARLNEDGSLDTTFKQVFIGVYQYIYAMLLQSDGKIVVSGNFLITKNVFYSATIRLNSNGTVDSSFFSSYPVSNSTAQTIAIQNDGKLLISGNFTTYNGVGRNRLARLNPDGTLDNSFAINSGLGGLVETIAVQSDGKFLVGGYFTSYNGTPRNSLARLNTDGTLDTTFNSSIKDNSTIKAIVIQSDGKILVGGYFTSYSGTSRKYLVRLNPDSTVDESFNPDTVPNNPVYRIVLQSDGKILITGEFSIYVGAFRNYLARLNSDGSLDTSFNPDEGANIAAITLQSDGKILVGGNFRAYNGTSRNGVARLNPDGSLDTSFNPGTGVNFFYGNERVAKIAIQNDGKILIGGEFTSYNGTLRSRLARLNADGSLDTSFTPDTGLDNAVETIIVQSDGKILIGGQFTTYKGVSRNRIARLNRDGTLDTSFNPGAGANDTVLTMALQSDSKLLIGGSFTSVDNYTRDYIARLENNIYQTATKLISSANPAQSGQSVTFTTTVSPITATGSVRLDFGGSVNNVVTVTLSGGVATYVTNTLPVGQIPVTATYLGDAIYGASSSNIYSQKIVSVVPCLVVSATTDDGAASACGTFSYALTKASEGQTIIFALSAGNTIAFTGSLTPTVAAGVTIDGGLAGVTLDGNGMAGDGLRLSGNDILANLTIRRFAGRELVLLGKGNKLYRVRLES